MKKGLLSGKLSWKLMLPIIICCFIFLVSGVSAAQSPNAKINQSINDTMVLPVLVVDDQPTSPPLLSITVTPGQLAWSPEPPVVVAIWEDGTVVRSQNEIQGGAPYYTGMLEPEQIQKVLSEACWIANHIPPSDPTSYLGFDCPWTTIAVWSDECVADWKSWHELMEASGRAVATDTGVRGLQPGETVEQVRKDECSKEFQNFIHRWGEIKTLMLKAAPIDTLEPADPNLMFQK